MENEEIKEKNTTTVTVITDGVEEKREMNKPTPEEVAQFKIDFEKALEDFNHRAKGGTPDDIPEVNLSGAPMQIANLLKAAGLTPSTSEANRNIEQNGVKIDGATIADKQLKVEAGTYVVQVGKRKFAKITLS